MDRDFVFKDRTFRVIHGITTRSAASSASSTGVLDEPPGFLLPFTSRMITRRRDLIHETGSQAAFRQLIDRTISSLLPKDSIERLLSGALSHGGDFSRSTSNVKLHEHSSRRAQDPLSPDQDFPGRRDQGHIRRETGYAYSDDLEMTSLFEAARVASQMPKDRAPRSRSAYSHGPRLPSIA